MDYQKVPYSELFTPSSNVSLEQLIAYPLVFFWAAWGRFLSMSHTSPVGCWPTCSWRKPQAGSGWLVSGPSLWSSSLTTSSWLDSGPYSDLTILECSNHCPWLISSRPWRLCFRIIDMLLRPVVAGLDFSLMVPLNCHKGSWCNPPFSWFLRPGSLCPWERSIPQIYVLAAMLDRGHSVLRLVFFSFLPPDIFSIQYSQRAPTLSHQTPGWLTKSWDLASDLRRASSCLFLSSGVLPGPRPWRPPLCKTCSLVGLSPWVVQHFT